MSAARRTAIIVGADPRIIVPTARSLHRQGIRCVVAVPPEESFSTRSRAVADVMQLQGTLAESATLLALLADAQQADWITAASDAGLAILAVGYDRLSAICPLGCPTPAIVARVLDQSLALAAAESCGLPIYKATGKTARDATPTHVTCVAMLVSDGAPVTVFQYHLAPTSPLDPNRSTAAVSDAPDPELVSRSVKLLQKLEWNGVALIEFKRDAPHEDAAISTVTGRFWASISLPISLGVDFPRYAWETSRGTRPAPPSTYRRDARMGIAALWSPSDPMPAIQEIAACTANTLVAALRGTALGVFAADAARAHRNSRQLAGYRRLHYLARRALRLLGVERKQRLPTTVSSVLFVCHGNIMRSAAAAQFLRDALSASGTSHIAVGSAGTAARLGCSADPRVQDAARELGTSLAQHRSQPLTNEVVNQADVIFAMDDLNVVNIEADFPQARGKVRLLGGMDGSDAWQPAEIVDPYSATRDEVTRAVWNIHRFVVALQSALTAREATR